MKAADVAHWMNDKVLGEGCIYQDDVVDHLVKSGAEDLLRENVDGNLVVGRDVLAAFLKLTADTVVWVKPDRYWRLRCSTDEPGRDARG